MSSTDLRFERLKNAETLTKQEIKDILEYDSFEKYGLEVKDGYFYYHNTRLPDILAANLKENRMEETTFVALRNLWVSLIKRGASQDELRKFIENCENCTPFTDDGTILLSKGHIKSDKCAILISEETRNFNEMFAEYYPNNKLTKGLRKAFINYFLNNNVGKLNKTVFTMGYLNLPNQELISLLRSNSISHSCDDVSRRSVERLTKDWTKNKKLKAIKKWKEWSEVFNKMDKLLDVDESYTLNGDYKLEDYRRFLNRDVEILTTQNLELKVPNKLLKLHGLGSPYGDISVAQGTHDLARLGAEFKNCISGDTYQDDCRDGKKAIIVTRVAGEPYIIGSFRPNGNPIHINGYQNRIKSDGEGEEEFINVTKKFGEYVSNMSRKYKREIN